jgi:hypothetical protein
MSAVNGTQAIANNYEAIPPLPFKLSNIAAKPSDMHFDQTEKQPKNKIFFLISYSYITSRLGATMAATTLEARSNTDNPLELQGLMK